MSVFNTSLGAVEIGRIFSGRPRVFFVGIGGIQMHALALMLHRRGFSVGGSDREAGESITPLRRAGIPVFLGHSAANIAGYGLLVYTLAVADDNPELVAARQSGIPCISRADLLGYLMADSPTRVTVAGMHGKSTVTAMLAAALSGGGADPTVMSGAPLAPGGSVYRSGGGEIFLAEACEYKDSFLRLDPTLAIALNMEEEHTDYFKTRAALEASFTRHLSGARQVILPADRDDFAPIRDAIPGEVITFGLSPEADARAAEVSWTAGCPSFTYIYRGRRLGRVSLAVPGAHNLQNALATLAAVSALGADFAGASTALSGFRGAERRLERRGVWREMTVFEDYAHHPTEIGASLSALRGMMSQDARLHCVFQPHTYSRTAAFFDGFVRALAGADSVTLLDIYAARESNESGVSSAALAAAIPGGAYAPDPAAALRRVAALGRAGDFFVYMGAGSIGSFFRDLPTSC